MTVLECVVAIGIFMVLATLSLQLYIVAERAIGRQQATASREGDQRALLAALRRDARLAQAATVGAGGRSLALVLPDGRRVEYRATATEVSRQVAGTSGETFPVAQPPSFVVPATGPPECVAVRFAAGRPGLTLHLRNARGGL